MRKNKDCLIDGCGRNVYSGGYCNKHYSQIRRTGKILTEKISNKGECMAEGCKNSRHSKGYCQKHYLQVKKYGKLIPSKEHGFYTQCKVEGCDLKHAARGYCDKHYSKYMYLLKVRNKIE